MEELVQAAANQQQMPLIPVPQNDEIFCVLCYNEALTNIENNHQGNYRCRLYTRTVGLRSHLNKQHKEVSALDINQAYENVGRQNLALFVDCRRCNEVFCHSLTNHVCKNPNADDANSNAVESHQSSARDSVNSDIPPEILTMQNTELFSKFCWPLAKLHHQYRTYMIQLIIELFTLQTQQDDLDLAEQAATAFFVLPGLISQDLSTGHSFLSVGNFLRAATASASPASYIINVARRCLMIRATRDVGTENPGGDTEISSRVKRIEALIDDGRYSAAMIKLEELYLRESAAIIDPAVWQQPTVPLTIEQVRARVQALHPEYDEENDFIDASPEALDQLPAGLIVTTQQVADVLANLDSDKSGGASGWTNNVVRYLYNVTGSINELRPTFLGAITAFFNACAAGKISQRILKLWCLTRSCLIPKEGGGYRPLGIGEVWYRIMGRTIVRVLGPDIANQLMPLQLGSGVSGGVEMAARSINLAMRATDVVRTPDGTVLPQGYADDPACLISLDISNAFNTMPRRQMFTEICDKMPKLARWFASMYSFKAELRSSQGVFVGYSSTGVRQGASESSACHNFGLQPALVAIDTAIKEICAEFMNTARQPLVVAICDDIEIVVPRSKITEVCHTVIDIMERHDRPLNRQKCVVVGPGVREYVGEVGFPFPLLEDGKVVLGIPMGTQEYIESQVVQMLERQLRCLTSLHHLSAQSQYILLKYCLNTRPTYLCRIAEIASHADTFRTHFDQHITRALARLLRAHDIHNAALPDSLLSRLRSLPQKLGGLGILAHGGPVAEYGRLKSRRLTERFIHAYYPNLSFLMSDLWTGLQLLEPQLVGGEVNGGESPGPPAPGNGNSPAERVQKIQQEVAKGIHAELAGAPETQSQAAWFKSTQCPGTGRFLEWRGGPTGYYRLTDQEFLDSVRLRLAMPPLDNPPGVQHLCTCHQRMDLSAEPLHVLDCTFNNSGLAIKRHDRIRDALALYIRGCCPNAVIHKEQQMTGTRTGQNRRADLVVYIGATTHIIDVSICEPGAPAYREQNQHYGRTFGSSVDQACAAAQRREADKVSRWRGAFPEMFTAQYRTFSPRGQVPPKFVPFVIEATGRLGPAAECFMMYYYASTHTQPRSYFLSRISVILAKYNAVMLNHTRANILNADANRAPAHYLAVQAPPSPQPQPRPHPPQTPLSSPSPSSSSSSSSSSPPSSSDRQSSDSSASPMSSGSVYTPSR